jgi:hypothetical protein
LETVLDKEANQQLMQKRQEALATEKGGNLISTSCDDSDNHYKLPDLTGKETPI